MSVRDVLVCVQAWSILHGYGYDNSRVRKLRAKLRHFTDGETNPSLPTHHHSSAKVHVLLNNEKQLAQTVWFKEYAELEGDICPATEGKPHGTIYCEAMTTRELFREHYLPGMPSHDQLSESQFRKNQKDLDKTTHLIGGGRSV